MLIVTGDIIRLRSPYFRYQYREVIGTEKGICGFVSIIARSPNGIGRIQHNIGREEPSGFDIIGHKTTDYSDGKATAVIRLFLLNDML